MQIPMILKASEGEASKIMEGLVQIEFVLWKNGLGDEKVRALAKAEQNHIFHTQT